MGKGKSLLIFVTVLVFVGVLPFYDAEHGRLSIFTPYGSAFDLDPCVSDCGFKYSVDHYRDGTVILPNDTPRRRAYQKCVEKCQDKFFSF